MQLMLTREQAALLAPILQQISVPSKRAPKIPAWITVTSELAARSRCEANGQPSASIPHIHDSPILVNQLETNSLDIPANELDYNHAESGSSDKATDCSTTVTDDDCCKDWRPCLDSEGCKFTMKELLEKKKMNDKSTRAQNFLNISKDIYAVLCSYLCVHDIQLIAKYVIY